MWQVFQVEDIAEFKAKALQWATVNFAQVSFLENNGISYPHQPFPCMLAAGAKCILPPHASDCLAALHDFHEGQWLFGYLGYDLKNQIEKLSSQRTDLMGAPDYYFYEPQYLIRFEEKHVSILAEQANQVFDAILQQHVKALAQTPLTSPVKLQSLTSQAQYLADVAQIKNHIIEGDVYELNYCMAYTAEQVELSPLEVYQSLNRLSPMPFSVFQKVGDHYLICASPERFMKKTGQQLISQPIKGTAKRGNTEADDDQIKHQLRHDEKELAENMMIVDLVRNDLARSAVVGSTKVDEMFGIYTFRHVHQMISTVTATLRPDVSFTQALRHAFPMGSMTGAPKIRAMELIETYEKAKRGLFSGAVGFITPEGDFDFNVVIRSLFYNAASRCLSFQVGSAITYDSVPEQEYAECLLKAQAIRQVINDLGQAS